jgi:geranylgeranyl pyrophosphate synthase
MNPTDYIQILQQKIESVLLDILDHQKSGMLYKPMIHPLQSGGKRIRPLLCLLSAEAVGGNADRCLQAAAAIELLHTFTLVHDDIMDHDPLRRGHPAVHVQWDEPTAILAGDGLVTLAYQSLLLNDHPNLIEVMKRFTQGLLILCEGQALDKSFETRPSVTMEEYRNMIYKKTAKLIEVSSVTGAMLGNGTREMIHSLSQFSEELGIAFQIQDDLLDISEENISGKPQFSDLIEKKKTFLTIHFEQTADEACLQKYRSLTQNRHLPPRKIRQILECFTDSGTLDAARTAIHESMDKALEHLHLLPHTRSRDTLEWMAGKIRDRNA